MTPRTAIVVGAGVAGLATSLALARRGFAVTCFESTGLGAGCSYASVGLIYPSTAAHANDVLTGLQIESLRSYPHALARIAEEAEETIRYRSTSLLELATSAGELDELREAAVRLEGLGLDNHALSSEEARRLEPTVRATFGGVLFEGGLWVDSPSLLAAMAIALGRKGGVLESPARVDELHVEAGRCDGVSVDGDVRRADFVVVCAGSKSGHLIDVGPVAYMKGQSFIAKGNLVTRPVYVGQLDMVPIGDGTTLVGATQELGSSDLTPTDDGIRSLITALQMFTTWNDKIEVIEHRVGVRSAVAGELPVVAKHPTLEGLYAITGLWRNGLALCHQAAEMVADLIEGRLQRQQVAGWGSWPAAA
jgi:glycine oxidase